MVRVEIDAQAGTFLIYGQLKARSSSDSRTAGGIEPRREGRPKLELLASRKRKKNGHEVAVVPVAVEKRVSGMGFGMEGKRVMRPGEPLPRGK